MAEEAGVLTLPLLSGDVGEVVEEEEGETVL